MIQCAILRDGEVALFRLTKWSVFLLCLSLLAAACSVPQATSTPSTSATAVPASPSATAPTVTATSPAPLTRPNIVLIISDDQRYDSMEYMPITQARIFDQGVTFTRTYVTTPLCCPSRASMFTGLYAHNHHAYDNFTLPDKPTVIEALHSAGYYTGLVGKYLNPGGKHERPEFDYWVAYDGHTGSKQYFDPRLNINGQRQTIPGYVTFVLQDYVLEFLQKARQQPNPFFLVFAPTTPHYPADPAPGDEKLYPDLPPLRPPNYMEEDLSDKPVWIQNNRAADPTSMDDLHRKQIQSLHSLDTTVGNILDALHTNGQDRNTIVIYLSDNGLFLGEHRIDGKEMAYEEAVRVPFGIWYPPLVSEPRVESKLIANIDIAPTLYELAGVPVPGELDGRSLVPLLKGTATDWRTWLLLEAWPYPHSWRAIRTNDFLYVETAGDISELYDMVKDPYQLQNQYQNPAYAATVKELAEILHGLNLGAPLTPAIGWN
jgi:N-acetylglucosamine-6-sulfatase